MFFPNVALLEYCYGLFAENFDERAAACTIPSNGMSKALIVRSESQLKILLF